MKKKILMGAAIGTAGLVALTGATFADSSGQSATHGGGIKDRVAEILGIAPEDLQSAMQQARSEHRDEQLSDRLAQAVEAGTITQEEAEAISAWIDAKPEVLTGMKGFGHRGNLGTLLGAGSSEERINALVERLVTAEKITEEDAQAITDWLAAAPVDALSKLGPQQGDHEGRGRSGEHRRDGDHRQGFRGHMFGEGPEGRMFEGRFHIRPYSPPAEPGSPSSDSNTATSVVVGDPV